MSGCWRLFACGHVGHLYTNLPFGSIERGNNDSLNPHVHITTQSALAGTLDNNNIYTPKKTQLNGGGRSALFPFDRQKGRPCPQASVGGPTHRNTKGTTRTPHIGG